MDKFLNRPQPAQPAQPPSQAVDEFITIKFEASIRHGRAGIGYVVIIDGKIYEGCRHIGEWDYNEALCLALLDAIESLEQFAGRKLRLLHRGCRFQLLYYKLCQPVSDTFEEMLEEVKTKIKLHPGTIIRLRDKSEFKQERKLAYKASVGRIQYAERQINLIN